MYTTIDIIIELVNKNNEFKLWHEEEVKHTTKLISYVIYLQDLLCKNEIEYNRFKA